MERAPDERPEPVEPGSEDPGSEGPRPGADGLDLVTIGLLVFFVALIGIVVAMLFLTVFV